MNIKNFFYLIIPLLFLTGCDSAIFHVTDSEPMGYVFAFNNLEVLILMISMTISSFIYSQIVAPFAMSLIGLAVIFDVFKFFFQMMKLEAEKSMFWDTNLGIQFIFKLIGITVLLISAPIGILVQTAVPKEDVIQKTLDDIYSSYELQEPVPLRWGNVPEDLFHPDSIFYTNPVIPYKAYLSSVPFLKKTLKEDSSEFSVQLPIALGVPITLADSILYGTKESKGIIPRLFPNSFPVLIFKPDKIFDAIFENAPIMQIGENNLAKGLLLQIALDKAKLNHDINYDLKDLVFQYNNVPLTVFNYFVLDTSGENLEKIIRLTKNEKQRELSWKKIETIIKDSNEYREKIIKIFDDPESFMKGVSKDNYYGFLALYENAKNKQLKDSFETNNKITPSLKEAWYDNFTKRGQLDGDRTYPLFDTSKLIGGLGTKTTYLSIFSAVTLPKIDFNDPNYIDYSSKILKDNLNFTEVDKNKIKETSKYIYLKQDFKTDINHKKVNVIIDIYNIENPILNTLLNTEGNLYEELIRKEVDLVEKIGNYDVEKAVTESDKYLQEGFIPPGERNGDTSKMPNNSTARKYYYNLNVKNYFKYLFEPSNLKEVKYTDIKDFNYDDKFEYNYVVKLYGLLNETFSQLDNLKMEYLKKLAEDLSELDENYKNKEFLTKLINIVNDNNNIIYELQNKIIKSYNEDVPKYKSDLKGYLQAYANRYFSTDFEIKEGNNLNDNSSSSAISNIKNTLGLNGSLLLPDDREGAWGFTKMAFALVLNIFLGFIFIFAKLVYVILKLAGSYLFALLYTIHIFGIVMVFMFFPLKFVIKAIFYNKYDEPIYESFKNYLGYRMTDFVFLFILALLGVIGPILLLLFQEMNFLLGTLFSIALIIFTFYLVGIFIKEIFELLGAKDTLGLQNMWQKSAGFMAKEGLGGAIRTSMYGSAASLVSAKKMVASGQLFGTSMGWINPNNNSNRDPGRLARSWNSGKDYLGKFAKDVNSVVGGGSFGEKFENFKNIGVDENKFSQAREKGQLNQDIRNLQKQYKNADGYDKDTIRQEIEAKQQQLQQIKNGGATNINGETTNNTNTSTSNESVTQGASISTPQQNNRLFSRIGEIFSGNSNNNVSSSNVNVNNANLNNANIDSKSIGDNVRNAMINGANIIGERIKQVINNTPIVNNVSNWFTKSK